MLKYLAFQDYRGRNGSCDAENARIDGRTDVVPRSDRRNHQFHTLVSSLLHIHSFDGPQRACPRHHLQSIKLGVVQRDKRQRRFPKWKVDSHL